MGYRKDKNSQDMECRRTTSDVEWNGYGRWWRRNKAILWYDGKIWLRRKREKTKGDRGIPWDMEREEWL